MKKLVKKFVTSALFLAALISAPTAAAADSDMPLILTLKTNIYNYVGPDNYFTIYFGSLKEDTEIYVEGPKSSEYVWVSPYSLGTDSDGDKAVIATAVPLSVTAADNTVRIYGDASQIDYIDVHGCYLNSIEFNGDFKNLSVIDLSHNELSAIDLSALTSLNSIDLLDNAFTVGSNMKIGTNHPDLMILSVGINDAIDPELDLRNFPNLMYFSARNNYGLTSVDPSGCPDLVSLVLEVTNISSIDVSKNLNLDVLNLSNTKVTNIDVSKNVNLGELYASHEGSFNNADQYKLTSIDLTKNTKLQRLDLSGNKLTQIDLTNNPLLIMLYLQKNRLSEIDLSKCTRLSNVNLSNNLFTFATLPLPQPGWDYYYYRSPLPCNYKYKVGEPIDFSKEVIRAPYVDSQGNTITPQTFMTAWLQPRAQMADSIPATNGSYTYNNGVITFNEAFDDSVSIEFFCTAFPEWTMSSASFMVKTAEDFDKPTEVFSFTPTSDMAGKEVSFKLGAKPLHASVSYPADVTVYVNGNATTLTGAITAASLPETDNVKFTLPATAQNVQIAVTDGFAATALSIDGIKMSAIDVTPSDELTTLVINNAGLRTIDLSYNRSLQMLDLSNNSLTSVDLTPVRGDFEKFYLRNIILANNQLINISSSTSSQIVSLDASNNNFTSFDMRYYLGLKNLDLSNNKIKGDFDFEKKGNSEDIVPLENLNLSGNQISSLTNTDWSRIQSLDLSDNNLSFATLPLFNNSSIEYTYSPQKNYQIISAGAAVNLSNQNIGQKTTYVWKYSSDNTVVPTNLYTLDGGVTRFGEGLIDKTVYCEMTNSSFPAFNSAPLATTPMKVLDKPTALVAQFTTAETGTANVGFLFNTSGANAVYIDWNGDGSQYDEYLYDDNNTTIYRPYSSVKGKTAKVYSYTSAAEVSCIFLLNTPLDDFDATPMVNAEAIDIHGGGLKDGKIKIPQSSKLHELILDGNSLSTQTFPNLPALRSFNLGGNNYTSFDMTLYPNVMFMQLANNKISNIKLVENNSLYQLDLNGNNLTTIDLTGQKNLSELLIPDNNLAEIDLSPIKQHLRTLNVAGNNFTFATLPLPSEIGPAFSTYYYANQKPITAECVDGSVDLSSQYKVEDTETTYRWFLGNKQDDVYYDAYYEMFVGEELEGPGASSDPEYTISDGVTTFRYMQNRKVICAMTNEALPNLILYTTPTTIDKVGVEDVLAEGNPDSPVDVFTISGVRIRTNVDPTQALEGLAPGLYIVGNKKVYVK